MCTHISNSVMQMPNMTLAIPEDLHSFIKSHNEIRRSEIARRAMWEYARKLEILDRLVEKSEFTEDDAAEFDSLLKKGLRKHYDQE